MRVHSSISHKDDIYTILMNSTTPLRSRVDFGPGVRHRVAPVMRQVESGEKVLLLSQASLPEKWIAELKADLEGDNFRVHSLTLPDGEDAKSLEQLTKCWQLMQEKEFTRKDTVLAIGGGAVSDLAGFCASTYLRGVKLILVPTTLLAQVDASIGGKTAINLQSGKNLAGSFYFPHSVIVDPEFLSTLPERELKSGMGEIVKYAFIEDTIAENTEYRPGPRPLLAALPENFSDGIKADNPFFAPLISICIRMKLGVVLADPFEQRLRRCLNLGHTVGHGIEKVTNYQISHGEAVSIGTAFAFKLAAMKNMITPDEQKKAGNLLTSLGLPSSIPADIDIEKLTEAVAFDKKRTGDSIAYVLPEKYCGRVSVDTNLSVRELAEAIRS